MLGYEWLLELCSLARITVDCSVVKLPFWILVQHMARTVIPHFRWNIPVHVAALHACEIYGRKDRTFR